MDKRTVYSKVKQMLDSTNKKVMTLWELQGLIMVHLGSTQSTIDTALRTMAMTGLIKDIGESRFKIIKNAM